MLNFIECLSEIIEENILNDRGELVLMGDFNVHMDSPEAPDTILFNDFLDSLNLKNLVDFPTHLSNHSIDLIITDKNSSLISHPRRGHMLSDHHFIHADLQIITQPPPLKYIKYRKLKSISSSNFEADLRSINLSGNTLSECIESYNSNLVRVLDSHAPQKECRLRPHHSQPWFDDKIKEEIRICCKKEKVWLKDQTEYNLNAFYQQRRYVANLIKKTQKSFIMEKLMENKTNYKEIFNITNKLLNRNTDLPLPPLMTINY